jgi:hypothetical protein
LPIEITMSMVRANSAVKIAGPRHGTTSIRTFGACLVIFAISGGIRSSTARSGIIRRNWRSLPCGVECIGDKQRAHLVERLRQRGAQPLRPRRQLHRAPGAHQQRVADQVAQPLQRVAGGRLRQPDPHRGAADIGFAEQASSATSRLRSSEFKFIQ